MGNTCELSCACHSVPELVACPSGLKPSSEDWKGQGQGPRLNSGSRLAGPVRPSTDGHPAWHLIVARVCGTSRLWGLISARSSAVGLEEGSRRSIWGRIGSGDEPAKAWEEAEKGTCSRPSSSCPLWAGYPWCPSGGMWGQTACLHQKNFHTCWELRVTLGG